MYLAARQAGLLGYSPGMRLVLARGNDEAMDISANAGKKSKDTLLTIARTGNLAKSKSRSTIKCVSVFVLEPLANNMKSL